MRARQVQAIRARSPRMRAALLVLAPLLAAGCLGEPTVRAALLEETFALDERAPASVVERMGFSGCPPGTFDGERVVLPPSDLTPSYVMVVHRTLDSRGPGALADPMAGHYVPLSASNSGWIDFGARGGWGWSGPFLDVNAANLTWDRRGAALDGVPLREGEFTERTLTYEHAQDDVVFTVTHTIRATSLGRVPYEMRDVCP